MVRADSTLAAVAAILLAACPAEDTGQVDAGSDADVGDPADADVGDPGLLFRFVAEPVVPGTIPGGDFPTTLERAAFELEDVRSFGDAAPGDERTTLAKVELDFASEPGANIAFFPNAPPSRYSHLVTEIQSYSLSGTVILDQDPIPFSIEDTPPTPLSVDVSLEDVEVVDALVEVEIDLHLGELVKEVDWEAFDPGSTSIEIGAGSPQLDELREHIAELFRHEDHSLTDD
jgi:hypothetical protein